MVAQDSHPKGTHFPYRVGQVTICRRPVDPEAKAKDGKPAKPRPPQFRICWREGGRPRETTKVGWTAAKARAKEIDADLTLPGSVGQPEGDLVQMFERYYATNPPGGKRNFSLWSNHAKPHMEGLAIRDYTPQLSRRIVQAAANEGYSRHTLHGIRASLTSATTWAIHERYLPPGYNPVARVALPAPDADAKRRIRARRAQWQTIGAGLLGLGEDDPDDDDEVGPTRLLLAGAIPNLKEAEACRAEVVRLGKILAAGLFWDVCELCGLRLGEAAALTPASLDDDMVLHIDWQVIGTDPCRGTPRRSGECAGDSSEPARSTGKGGGCLSLHPSRSPG